MPTEENSFASGRHNKNQSGTLLEGLETTAKLLEKALLYVPMPKNNDQTRKALSAEMLHIVPRRCERAARRLTTFPPPTDGSRQTR